MTRYYTIYDTDNSLINIINNSLNPKIRRKAILEYLSIHEILYINSKYYSNYVNARDIKYLLNRKLISLKRDTYKIERRTSYIELK